jgi:hypothetical protein
MLDLSGDNQRRAREYRDRVIEERYRLSKQHFYRMPRKGHH